MADLVDIVEVEDPRIEHGEIPFKQYLPLRNFRGNYGVPRKVGEIVVKGFFTTDDKTISKLVFLQEEYQIELERFLPVIPTSIHASGSNFYLTQPFIEGPTYEQFLQSASSSVEKERVYKKLLYSALNFVSQSDKVVGFDAKPENWIQNPEKQWYYLDMFPPFLIEERFVFEEIFNLRSFERNFTKNPEKSFFRNKRKIARRFWIKSEKFCSDIDYLSATILVVKEFDKKIAEFFSMFTGDYK